MHTPDGNSDVSVKEYLEALIRSTEDLVREIDRRHQQRADLQDKAVAAALTAAQKAVDAALAAQDAAVTKAEKQAELWRASANEWRSAMDDREKKFASSVMLEALEGRVRDNADRIRDIEARKVGSGSVWTHAGQFVALAAAVIATIFAFLK